MNPDANWKETRILAEDLDTLLGIPVGTSEDFLTVLENLIIHRFVEILRDTDQRDTTDYSIELPYLGTLVITPTGKKKLQLSISFSPRSVLYRKLKSAYFSHESPLVTQLGKLLGDQLVSKFENGEIEDERR